MADRARRVARLERAAVVVEMQILPALLRARMRCSSMDEAVESLGPERPIAASVLERAEDLAHQIRLAIEEMDGAMFGPCEKR